MTSTTSRTLRLLSLLQTRRSWSGAELAERLGVSARTLRRDIDRLRDLDYPVSATTGVGGGYRLEAGAALPPLLLDDDEAVAIAVGLRTAADGTVAGLEESSLRALAKLERVLPARLRDRVSALQTYTVPLTAAGPTVAADVLTTITQACRDHERLRFGYRSRADVASDRLVEPHRLVVAHRRWYLVAWDTDRGDWRTFRVDRLRSPRSTRERFSPHALPAADAAAFVARAISTSGARHQAQVLLHSPLDVVARHLRPHEGVLEAVDTHTCVLHTGTDSLEWLAMVIGLLGVEFAVREPPELVERVEELAGRLTRGAASSRP